ncbi:MAG: type VI secretion system baseplate subunit TssF [Candidatus Korobacteraceae bacterium]
MRDDLRLYYEQELDYLRKEGVQFAEKHPKIASRLVIEPTKCEDPHVERLLEAFAFLTARVHLKIDDEFPEITEALLTVLYPQLVCPVPSMSVVEFQLDSEKGKLASSISIRKNSPLQSRPVQGVPCTFRTCYDTVLWPVSVAAAEMKPPSRLQPPIKAADASAAIRIQLNCAPGVTFQELKIDRLRFYMDGETGFLNGLYELLFSQLNRIVVRDATPDSKVPEAVLPADALREVGFDASEGLLPYSHRSFIGHHLLLEYFAFPQKFFFFDITGLQHLWTSGPKQSVEFVFLLSEIAQEEQRQRLELELSAKTFRLGCTPVVNLFPQVAEPIQLNQHKYEYQVVPDVRRPYSTEIYSVDEVAGINTDTQQRTVYEPFYSLRHAVRGGGKPSSFYLARRRAAVRPNDEGTDIYLSLVDLAMRPVNPDANILSIRTTCTNRDLPARLPFGNAAGDFELEGAASIKSIVALCKPTQTVRPASGKAAQWRLISHLSLNYLSLVQEGAEALKQILRLYDFGQSAYSQNIIDSILRIQTRPRFTRLSSQYGITFARGTGIELHIDESQFVGGSAFLFASVLEHFLGLTASLNSFTQLSMKTPQRKEYSHEWQPRAGRRILV